MVCDHYHQDQQLGVSMARFEEIRLAIAAEYLSESRELKVTSDDGSKYLRPVDQLEMES